MWYRPAMYARPSRSAQAFLGFLPQLLSITLVTLAGCRRDDGLVKFNSEPHAEITAPADGETVPAYSVVSLRGAASDANDTAASLTARWFVDEVETCVGTPDVDGLTTCEAEVPDADALAIRLEVSDDEGAAASDSLTLAVTPDGAPTVTIEAPAADEVYYANRLVTLRAVVGDTEDMAESLLVHWESSLDGDLGSPTPNSDGVVESFVNLSEGEHALQVFAEDSVGNDAQASVIIEVGPPNSAPACAITEPADGAAGEVGATVTFRATASDVDIPEDQLTVTWTSDKDGAIGASTPASDGRITFAWADLSVNTHVVSMQVADELGETCTAQVVYTVGSAPTITLESPADGEVVNEGEAVAFTAVVADGEDPAADLLVSWASDVDGVFYEGPPDSSGLAQLLESGLSVGEHALTVTVTDTDGLYATALGTFTVNGLPSAPGITIEPASPLTTDDLLATVGVSSVDPEGDAVTYTYAWSVDGAPSAASTTATLPASATTRGEVWRVDVTASDAFGSGAAGAASVTIGDTAPSVSVSLTPTVPVPLDTLVCVATSADADGDTLSSTFTWTVGGAPVSATSTSGATSTLAGAFVAGDTVTCAVTVEDGAGGTATDSASVIVTNSAPTVSVSLTPATVYTNDTLRAVVTAADADGDTLSVTIDWYVEGALVQTGASDTLDGAYFARDEEVYAVVTADDGTDTTTATSAAIFVSDTPPEAPEIAVDPTDPLDTEDLVCGIVTASVDADGDPVTYTLAWTVDGVATTVATTTTLAGDTIDAADTASGDTWTCIATPTDGTASGPPATASVTIGDDGVAILVLSGTDSAGSSHVTESEVLADFVSRSGVAPTLTRSSTAPGTVAGYDGYDIVIISEDANNSYSTVLGTSFGAAEVDALLAYWEGGGHVYFAREYGTDAVMNELYWDITGTSTYWSGTTTAAYSTTLTANAGTLFAGTTRAFLETGSTSSEVGNPTLASPFVRVFNLPGHTPTVGTVVYACEGDGSGLLVIDGERGTPWYSSPTSSVDPASGTFGPAVGDVMTGGATWSRSADCADSDGDGVSNGLEGYTADTDGDGTLDYLDAR